MHATRTVLYRAFKAQLEFAVWYWHLEAIDGATIGIMLQCGETMGKAIEVKHELLSDSEVRANASAKVVAKVIVNHLLIYHNRPEIHLMCKWYFASWGFGWTKAKEHQWQFPLVMKWVQKLHKFYKQNINDHQMAILSCDKNKLEHSAVTQACNFHCRINMCHWELEQDYVLESQNWVSTAPSCGTFWV